MNRIKAKKIIYIKLGRGGKWEKACIEKDQTVRLGFDKTNHKDCLKGNWEAVKKSFRKRGKDKGTATRKTNEIKTFYEEKEDTLWITFYANKMWWCFANSKIKLLKDKSKTRKVIGHWHDKDITGKTLRTDSISGHILQKQAFRGTNNEVKDRKYVLAKINGEKLTEVVEAENARIKLETKLGELIKKLHWKDFENLIDLIFRQAGWQRLGEVGKTAKTLDLDLFSPVTNEKCMVQIKSSSDLNEFTEYCDDFKNMHGYDKFFYVVHQPKGGLKKDRETKSVKLLLLDDISKLVIDSGLTEWLMKKVS